MAWPCPAGGGRRGGEGGDDGPTDFGGAILWRLDECLFRPMDGALKLCAGQPYSELRN